LSFKKFIIFKLEFLICAGYSDTQCNNAYDFFFLFLIIEYTLSISLLSQYPVEIIIGSFVFKHALINGIFFISGDAIFKASHLFFSNIFTASKKKGEQIKKIFNFLHNFEIFGIHLRGVSCFFKIE
jgi:hypothetical protein